MNYFIHLNKVGLDTKGVMACVFVPSRHNTDIMGQCSVVVVHYYYSSILPIWGI